VAEDGGDMSGRNLSGRNASGRKKRSAPLAKISEEMQVWSGLLVEEVAGWPEVTTKPMFGLTALYRGQAIFAALPKTRALGSPNAVAFKIGEASGRLMGKLKREPRIQETMMAAAKWFVFEMESDGDLRGVLEWLGVAYEGTGVSGKKR
jgi:hypothetical protein